MNTNVLYSEDARTLRVLQVNTYDAEGGAAKIAWDLFTAYRERGHCSWLAVGHKASSDPDVLRLPGLRLQGRWSHFWPSRALDFYLGREDFRYPGTRSLISLPAQHPDILHGHNLHGYYFDLRALPWLSRRLPVVLTLHDAWLISGHCAHSLGCERWKAGCGHCPDLGLYPGIRRDATATNWRRKQNIYARSRLYLATPSSWLMRKVEESMLHVAAVEARVIPNGVNLSVFHPRARSESRDILGIPRDTAVLLFAANGIRENRWKDYRTMREAIAQIADESANPILFLAVGEDSPPERIGTAEIRFVPYQTEAATMALYYQAADVYVHAARADTFPTTILEAMACGTPVVATAIGGIPEQIEDTRTGFLTPEGDAKELAFRLLQVLSDDELRERMSCDAADSARRRFDLRRQVDAYLDWYLEIKQKKALVKEG